MKDNEHKIGYLSKDLQLQKNYEISWENWNRSWSQITRTGIGLVLNIDHANFMVNANHTRPLWCMANILRFFAPYRGVTILVQPNINHAPKYRTHAQISIHTPKYWTHTQISIHAPKYRTHTQIPTTCSISWCDNLVPNVYGTEVFLTCSLHDAQDVIIFQVEWFSSSESLKYLLFIQTHALDMRIHHHQ